MDSYNVLVSIRFAFRYLETDKSLTVDQTILKPYKEKKQPCIMEKFE